MPIASTTILGALGALAAVLGLVLLAARAAKATGFIHNASSQRLALRETLALDRGRALRIVRCDGRELLLLTGSSNDLVVGWLPTEGQGQ